jgi:hypothetical protein
VITPADTRPGRAPGPPAWLWHAAAVAGALAAIVVLSVYSTAVFVTAGVLAAGAAGMAEWEALLRGRGRASEVGGLLTTVLAVSFVMILILAVADSGRH